MPTRAVLLDIDGVLVVSWEPLPGAAGAVRAFREAGLGVQFLTNTTSRTAESVRDALQAAGFEVGEDELTTAAIATAGFLAEHHAGARCLILNDGPLDDLGDVVVAEGDEPVDVVVIDSAGPSFDWPAINRAATAVLGGAALIGMHGTGRWRTSEGIRVDGGAYVAALEKATGVRATVVGKPAPTMFEQALVRAGVEPGEAVMVGDDVVADVLAAQAVGIRGVLVRTGKYAPGTLREAGAGEEPDAVLDSVADVPHALGIG
jgi:HAD superfamily hydrolase (TIGR01458 family)